MQNPVIAAIFRPAPSRTATPMPSSPAMKIQSRKGAAGAIAWYEKVVGAKVAFRMDAPDGKVMHAELHVGPARFMVTEERPEYAALSPQTVGGTSTA